MDKPEDNWPPINVKGVNPDAWQRARIAAKRRGETMGQWLTRACEAQANREANDGIIMPGQGAPPPVQPQPIPVDLDEVARLVASMGQAGVALQDRNQSLINRALYERLRLAMPVKPKGKKAIEAQAERQGALRIGRERAGDDDRGAA